ncbi:response regulator [Sinanaerobacter sp. ZZT-01]|uniref:response regulator n=1 Tax=Sinanaerobacter sp. ZZT-01 TaxID=3111540 RepID=UPI002D76EDEF|nr:response regulator [Sinanaerobacter sp. ZZT-01]WRR93747.1 response regulator [Sinanaerobacter sp. ZZT-01]
MNFIAVDDERLALENLLSKLKKAQPQAEIRGFLHPQKALDEIGKGFYPDVAFLDIEMYGMSGIELALCFKETLPKVNLVFVTGFPKYMPEAFTLHASGYITKPVSVEQIQEEIENLRYPLPIKEAFIQVQTFGNFEIFAQGKPLFFERSRTKELFACLVDRRGAGLTMQELAAILYEDRPYDSSLQTQLRVHISDLLKTLKKVGAKDVIVRKRNYIAVDTNQFDCDYYRFLECDVPTMNAFAGEYMVNYSWAELTTGRLCQSKEQRDFG